MAGHQNLVQIRLGNLRFFDLWRYHSPIHDKPSRFLIRNLGIDVNRLDFRNRSSL